MLIRSRSARLAALALAVTTPLVAANALPAFASGESATAVLIAPDSGSATTFTWNYTFGGGQHGLSNIAIRFCSAAILADVASASPGWTIFTSGDVGGGHTGFGPGIKFAVTDPSGSLSVTFKSEHPVSDKGLEIQSHSGDGQTGDTIESAKGPGLCPVPPVVVPPVVPPVVVPPVVVPPVVPPVVVPPVVPPVVEQLPPSGNDPTPLTTSDPGPSTSTVGTDVLGLTLATTDNPPAPLTPSAPLPQTASPTAPTGTLGEVLNTGGELPRTGSGTVQPLLALALALIASGGAVRAATSDRRNRSASSPG